VPPGVNVLRNQGDLVGEIQTSSNSMPPEGSAREMATPRTVVSKGAEVAVIIAAFNSGRFLDQALASLAVQTLPPSSVVVADDCSDDDTSDRARGWVGRLPVTVVRLECNSGPGLARDRAIRATHAPLLAMLDADDFFLPDHLETMVRTYADCPGLVSAQELAWYPGTGLRLPTQRRRLGRRDTQLTALLRGNFVNFGFFSRDLYKAAGGFGAQYFCEDWDLWIRMLRTGAQLTMAGHPTALHRVHPGSLSFDSARMAQHAVSYLNAALRGAQSPAEAAAVRSGIAALTAKLSFFEAMDLAARGERQQARRVACAALPASGFRASAGLLAAALAPSAAARLEQARRVRAPGR